MSDELVTLEDDDQVLDVELENYNVPVQEDVIHSGTTAYWEAQPSLVGEIGHIYAYTDYVNIDEEDVPAIKVGDGTTLLSDLPFVSGNNDILNAHITNTDIHVTAAEKETWNAKVSPEEGKGLSTNDFTNELKAKLEGIEAGAEANVQADWSQTLTTADDFIKNKPSIPENTSDLVNDSGFITAALAPVQGVKGSAESAYRKGNVSISKTDIGLGNVDNTADADKPISTATQAALNAKITNPSGGTAGQVLTKTVNGEEWADTSSVKSVNTIAPVNGDVTLGKGDVGLGNVTNDAQVKRSEMGTANGVATLDSSGKVPSAQLPSFVDDVLEYASASAFPETGETGKIYVALDTNLTYRWGGSAYVEISESLALGETSSTAYAGNKGKATTDALNTHLEDNVRHITNAERTSWNNKVDKEAGKSLSSNDFTTAEKEKLAGIAAGAEVNVQANWNESDQTSDAFIQNKPSIPSKTSELTNDSGFVTNTAMQSALDQKVDKVAGKGLSTEDFTSAEKTKLAGIEAGAQVNTITGVKGDAETDYRTGNVNITKENIGLGNVDNTSDADKPISTAVQTALDGKQATLTFDGTPTAGSTNPVTSSGIAAEISALNSNLSQKVSSVNGETPDTNGNVEIDATDIETSSGVAIKSVNGNPVTIADALQGKALGVNTALEPIQSGSGTPSPTNIRPITGRTQVEISNKDSEDVEQVSVTVNLGQTVYGGTLDVTNGVLTVGKGYVDLGTLDWQNNGGTGGFREFAVVISDKANGITNMMCSALEVKSANEYKCIRGRANSGNVSVVWDIVSVSDFKTAVSGYQLVYDLATPQTIQLTPAQINLLTGTNIISTNADDLSVRYYATGQTGNVEGNIAFLLDKTASNETAVNTVSESIAPTETGTATQNYVAGSYLMLNNKLCKVTSAIATGEQIIVGSNVRYTTVAEELAAILAQINA